MYHLRYRCRNAMCPLLAALTLIGADPAWCAGTSDSGEPVYQQALGIGMEEWTYPYPVHFLQLNNEGQLVRMAYMDAPATGTANGHTVVLLHGKNFAGFYWDGPIRLLTNAGYRVIVPDQIGFGKSSKPDLAYSFDLLSANTFTLLDSLQIAKATIVGHSTGGMLAVRMSLAAPERVERLVLEDPIGLEDYRRAIPYQATETLFQQQLGASPHSYRQYVKGYFVHWSAAFEHELVEPYVRIMASAEYPRFAKAAALTSQMIYQQPVVYELADLKMPVLVIYGEKDRTAPGKSAATLEMAKTLGNFPKMAHAAAAAIPNAQLVEVPDTGHIPHLEAPAIFERALLQFLAPAH